MKRINIGPPMTKRSIIISIVASSIIMIFFTYLSYNIFIHPLNQNTQYKTTVMILFTLSFFIFLLCIISGSKVTRWELTENQLIYYGSGTIVKDIKQVINVIFDKEEQYTWKVPINQIASLTTYSIEYNNIGELAWGFKHIGLKFKLVLKDESIIVFDPFCGDRKVVHEGVNYLKQKGVIIIDDDNKLGFLKSSYQYFGEYLVKRNKGDSND